MTPIPAIQAAIAASAVPFSFPVAPAGSQYVPIYLGAGQQPGRLATANAGNSNIFFVGGGGLNAAFAKAIANPGAYQNLQTALYNSVVPPATVASASYPATSPMQFALVQRPSPGQVFNNHEGTIIVDVFQPGTQPAGNPDNYAMIYVCPPNGQIYASPAAFLTAVEATALNLIKAVACYNQKFAPTVTGLATIEIVRVFLFSSSIYRQAATTVPQIAQAVCSGLLKGLALGSTGLKAIQLPNGSGEYAAVMPPAAD